MWVTATQARVYEGKNVAKFTPVGKNVGNGYACLDFVGRNVQYLPMSLHFDPNRPFNDLPALPPRVDLETKAILKMCVSARAKLAALKEAAALIPNQDVLINSIPLREAKDSSAIENIVTTNDKLFRFANADANQADSATKETLRYRTALLRGYESLKERPAADDKRPRSRSAARSRTSISISAERQGPTSGTTSGKVIYTPPEGEDVLRATMSDWERFIHDELRHRPAGKDGRRALPIRGNPSISGRKRANRAHPQHPRS